VTVSVDLLIRGKGVNSERDDVYVWLTWLTGEDADDPAALYGSEDMAVGQPAWYSIDGYSYGINDWRGNAVAENQRRRRPNDIPLDDVMPQTGNGSAILTETTTATTTTTTTAQTSRLTELLVYLLIDLYHKVVYLYSWALQCLT